MASQRSLSVIPLLSALVAGGTVVGLVVWRLHMNTLDARIHTERAALKKLLFSGKIPPNEEVARYLIVRPIAIQDRYRYWLDRVAIPAVAEAASADPQLYFQEQFHEVERTLERLAAARSTAVPEQLGFPKDLPPSDTVPRLLVQLSLIQEAATLIFEQGITALSSLKVEDPQPVAPAEGRASFLVRLPVRVRMRATLPQLMKVLAAIQRISPLVDVQTLRVSTATSSEGPEAQPTAQPATAPISPTRPAQASAPTDSSQRDTLDVELVLARYLVTAQPEPFPEGAADDKPGRGVAPRATPGREPRSRSTPRSAPERPSEHEF